VDRISAENLVAKCDNSFIEEMQFELSSAECHAIKHCLKGNRSAKEPSDGFFSRKIHKGTIFVFNYRRTCIF
jgi:hypothetical protein